MHAVLYVCLPRSQARSSLQARKKVCEYLSEEGFSTLLRFSGYCDYFGVGGRWSGRLTLLRLRHEQPKAFARFWKRYTGTATGEKAESLFRELFPDYQGRLPVNRGRVGFDGAPDDAQVLDEPLFQQLKAGFGTAVDYSYGVNEPNVIFTEDDADFDWPKTAEEAAKFWVVVIDYHH
jgi:hypothetical protein